MTGPTQAEPPPAADGLEPPPSDRLARVVDPATPGGQAPDEAPPEPEIGRTRGPATFSLDGRRAPGLYLLGWVSAIFGGGLLGAEVVTGTPGISGLILTVVGSLLLGLGLLAGAGVQGIERRDRVDLAYRGPSPFLVFFAAIPLTILVTVPFALMDLDPRAMTTTLVSVLLTDAVWILLIALTVVGIGALRWREIGPGIAGLPVGRVAADVAFGALAAVPVIVVTTILAGVLVRIVGFQPEGPLPVPGGGGDLVLGLLAAVVVAPIGEEIFYRGFATTAWARASGPTVAIVKGALFFSFAHILTTTGIDFGHAAGSAVIGFVGRLPVALALGWVFLRRGSLPASVALHATFNLILVLTAYASA